MASVEGRGGVRQPFCTRAFDCSHGVEVGMVSGRIGVVSPQRRGWGGRIRVVSAQLQRLLVADM